MHGERGDMLRLLTFRRTFQEFYDNPDSDNAERIVWMTIDTLLNSQTQQEMSQQWIEHLNEAG